MSSNRYAGFWIRFFALVLDTIFIGIAANLLGALVGIHPDPVTIPSSLSELELHSIEQPIRAGQWEEMARLAADSPLPIALDEELIGCNTPEGKRKLLSAINPQYIVLKPSLHGGICGGNEWIAEAEKRHIGWWITSALESNIGLNAIAQWCATFDNPLPQGLGTGLLFTDNVEMPLEVRKDCLWFCNDDI